MSQNLNANAAGQTPVFVNNVTSQQVVNNTSSRASITMGKDTNAPDKTLHAIDDFYDPDF